MRNAIVSGLVGAVTLSLAAVANAEEEARWYLNPSVGYLVTDPARDLQDETGVATIGVERRKGNWALELKGSAASPENELTPQEDDETDIHMYSLDTIRYIPLNSRLEPYVAFGIGHGEFLNSGDNGVGDSGETQGNYGMGVRLNLTEGLSIRGDLRGIYGFDHETADGMASIGLSVALGKTREPTTAAPVTPVSGDSDGDGVNDAGDACPDTPSGVAVDGQGCPLDSDGDGVPNFRDRCPETAPGVRVDARGCRFEEAQSEEIELKVYFAFDSAVVGQGYVSELEKVAAFMKKYPNTRVTLEGHADKIGDGGYNQDLSERRAKAVKAVLRDSYGIAGGRMDTVGFGENRPAATNDTAAGRAQNRRVEGVIRVRARN